MAPMRAAILLVLIGVSRPVYHLMISNDAILIVQTIQLCCCLTCVIFHGPNKITLSVYIFMKNKFNININTALNFKTCNSLKVKLSTFS